MKDFKKLHSQFSLLIILSILFFGLTACGSDPIVPPTPPEPDPPPTAYAALRDVRLTQTINGVGTFTVTEFDDELLFSSRLVFQDKPINWANPTFTQAFLEMFVITEENITVTTEDGTEITSVTIEIEEDNRVTVAFQQVNNSFNYLRDKVVVINIKATLPDDITETQAEAFNSTGFRTQSYFFVETIAQNVRSSIMIVNSRLNLDVLFDIVGDPRNHEYIYKLDVVLFVPSDVQPNPGWRRRISELMLYHQRFVMKWMEYWGYGAKSFGLPLDENGMVDIVMVRGAQPLASYPYSTASANAMISEINNWYREHNLTRHNPNHLFIITSVPTRIGISVPFFGFGRNAFALDFPGMARAMFNICPITNARTGNDAPMGTALIGGFHHEMHHGLGLPHAGNTRSQAQNPQYGVSLMGHGNSTYGRTPTFFTHACAAILNVSQVSSFTRRPFYNATTASVTHDRVTVNGNYITVAGSFTASENVTDVIVRFIRYPETSPGGAQGYTSIPFVTRPTGNTFEKIVPIWELSHRNYRWRIHTEIVMENGVRRASLFPLVYDRVSYSGGGYTLVTQDIMNDGTWTVTASHPLPYVDNPQLHYVVDGNSTTFLSQVKPGRTFGGVTVPAGDDVWFAVHFNQPTTFNTILLSNRNSHVWLNPEAASFYGSNDGVNFEPIVLNVELTNPASNTVTLPNAVTFSHLKVKYTRWHEPNGNTIQVTQLMLRNT